MVCGLAQQAGFALVGVVLALATLPALAGDEHLNRFGPFALASDGVGQLSSSAYSFGVRTDGVLRIGYRAPRSQCGALRVHLSVDERAAVASAPVGPGQQSDIIDLGPLAPGAHVVRVVAEGVAGGCNGRGVKSWGGTILAWTSGDDVGPALDGSAALGDVVLEVERVNFARGYSFAGKQVGADGLIRSYAADGKHPRSAPPVSDDGFYGADWLLAKRGSVSRVAGQVDAVELQRKFELARSIATRRALGTPSKHVAYDAGTANYCTYLRDAVQGAYRCFCFATRGDFEGGQTSAEATELVNWLGRLPAAMAP